MVCEHLVWVVPIIAFVDALMTLCVHLQGIKQKRSVKHGVEDLHRSFRDGSIVRDSRTSDPALFEKNSGVGRVDSIGEVGEVSVVEVERDVEKENGQEGSLFSKSQHCMSSVEIDV